MGLMLNYDNYDRLRQELRHDVVCGAAKKRTTTTRRVCASPPKGGRVIHCRSSLTAPPRFMSWFGRGRTTT